MPLKGTPSLTDMRSGLAPSFAARQLALVSDGQTPPAIRGGILKVGVPSLEVPIIRIILFWALSWGPLIWGNYYLQSG